MVLVVMGLVGIRKAHGERVSAWGFHGAAFLHRLEGPVGLGRAS